MVSSDPNLTTLALRQPSPHSMSLHLHSMLSLLILIFIISPTLPSVRIDSSEFTLTSLIA